jgi:transposase-like protein
MLRSDKYITKKERIIELLRKGTPSGDIALEVGTSIEYVYKEISRYNKRKELVETKKHESISGTRNELVTRTPDFIKVSHNPDFHLTPRPEQVMQDYYNLRPITEAGLKDMYDRFLKNQGPAEVISATGFNPDLVQKEYLRFQDMKSRSPIELQKLIVSKVRDAGPDLEPLMNKVKSGILLTNDELLIFTNYYSLSLIDNAIIRLVFDAHVLLPFGLKRLNCSFCGRPLPGMIIDPESQIGRLFKSIISGYRCTSCKEKLEEEFELRNSWDRLGGCGSNDGKVESTNVKGNDGKVESTNVKGNDGKVESTNVKGNDGKVESTNGNDSLASADNW